MRTDEFARIGGVEQGVICFAVSFSPWKLACQMRPRTDRGTAAVPAGPADLTRTSAGPNRAESEGKVCSPFQGAMVKSRVLCPDIAQLTFTLVFPTLQSSLSPNSRSLFLYSSKENEYQLGETLLTSLRNPVGF